MDRKIKTNPWFWIPTLYFAEGIPYFIVNNISVIMFNNMGMSKGDMAMYTSLLYLPWVIKPLWSPFVDIIKTKRWWVMAMQVLMSLAFALLAFSLPHPSAEMIAQGLSEDGKLMITIARKEGVDWDPLKDLTAKAYYILSEDFDLPPVKIFLEKTSPVGAGLGGGSADAAFALKMLNDLCGLGLDESRLASYAARLGSDCAFFVYDRPMIGEGRGEILTEIEAGFMEGVLAKYDLQVLTPEGVAVSTKDAYGGIRPHLPEVPLREALVRPVEEWDGVLVNDFEETVFAKYPELAAIKRSLYDSGAVYASMSGSGSALFALYRR